MLSLMLVSFISAMRLDLSVCFFENQFLLGMPSISTNDNAAHESFAETRPTPFLHLLNPLPYFFENAWISTNPG